VPRLAAALAQLPLLQRYGRSEATLAADLSRALERGERLLLEEVEGAPRGVCWLLTSGTFGMGGYLRLLAVIPGAHGQGVGATLLQAFEDEVGLVSRHAFLLVSDFNAGAQRFYERHGYQRIGALPGLVLPEVTELVYWKQLR
jgi:GNAT superfamily N-acetyltransferase